MNLSNSSEQWLQYATLSLQTITPTKKYVALEGLPCSGKTSIISYLGTNNKRNILDEVRIERQKETTLSYLQQEPIRKERIEKMILEKNQLLGDRSIISTIAFEAAITTYKQASLNCQSLDYLSKIAQEKAIILPSIILHYSISVDESIKRQRVRDRDILEGRLWYDRQFLELVDISTKKILYNLQNLLKTYTLDSNKNNLEEISLETQKILQVTGNE